MPNWCSNNVTLSSSKENIDALIVELQKPDGEGKILQSLRPRPPSEDGDWYGWNVNNWGTKWEVGVHDYEILSETSVLISFDSAWAPPTTLYEYLEDEGWSVCAYYYEPGMAFCGKYEDGFDNYYEYSGMSADEIREEIPTDVDEMFAISEYREDIEQDEEE